MIFLDNASTTKVFDLAVEKMNIIYLEDYFNPSATYKGGREVLSNISQARENVAKYLSAKKDEIYFSVQISEKKRDSGNTWSGI